MCIEIITMVDVLNEFQPIDIPSIPSDEPPFTLVEARELRKYGKHRSPCAKCKYIMRDKNGVTCFGCAKVLKYNSLEGVVYDI